MRNKKLLVVFLILFCSNRCAIEGTSFHLSNNSDYDVTILSGQEINDYKNGFLERKVINDRTIEKHNDEYMGFKEYELDQFKNNKKDYVFYVLDLNGRNDFLIRDSIKIDPNDISFYEIENCIFYNGKSTWFVNKN